MKIIMIIYEKEIRSNGFSPELHLEPDCWIPRRKWGIGSTETNKTKPFNFLYKDKLFEDNPDCLPKYNGRENELMKVSSPKNHVIGIAKVKLQNIKVYVMSDDGANIYGYWVGYTSGYVTERMMLLLRRAKERIAFRPEIHMHIKDIGGKYIAYKSLQTEIRHDLVIWDNGHNFFYCKRERFDEIISGKV